MFDRKLAQEEFLPEYTSGSRHYISPADFATIYNLNPLYNEGFDGSGQSIAIVSDVAGTTTDPVGKTMEISGIGPVYIYDTAGLDDTGELGLLRVEPLARLLLTAEERVLSCAMLNEDK